MCGSRLFLMREMRRHRVPCSIHRIWRELFCFLFWCSLVCSSDFLEDDNFRLSAPFCSRKIESNLHIISWVSLGLLVGVTRGPKATLVFLLQKG